MSAFASTTPTIATPRTSTAAGAATTARSRWPWLRLVGGFGILVLLVWQVGTGPFLAGLRVVDTSAVVAAVALGAMTTLACAWRWSLIAAGLGVHLPLRGAVAAYYRAMFLNTTLPGGVLGDVHRAVRHGLDIGDVGLGVRAVLVERVAGQAVLAAGSVAVLFVFASPVRSHMVVATLVALAVVLVLVATVRAVARGRTDRWTGVLRRTGAEIRGLSRRTWAGVIAASVVMMAGYLTTFLVAARTAGATAPVTVLLPLLLLALLAMALPLNIAGWGPREGVAAWVFAAAGLTSAQGVATAVTYGVLVLAASLPGAAVLAVGWLAQARPPVMRQGDLRG